MSSQRKTCRERVNVFYVWTGHHVYITDQNHGYENLDLPISQQVITTESSPNYDGVIAERRAGGEAADRKGEYVAPLRAASLLVLPRPD